MPAHNSHHLAFCKMKLVGYGLKGGAVFPGHLDYTV